MAFPVITILVFILLLYVAWPLVEEHEEPVEVFGPAGKNPLLELKDRKDRDLGALKELEFDLQTGKVSKEEFEAMRDNLKLAAISTLKAYDVEEKKQDEAKEGKKGKNPKR